MLDAGVAVIDGNLGSQGPVIPAPVGANRGSTQPWLQRLISGADSGKTAYWKRLSSKLQPGELYLGYSPAGSAYVRRHTFAQTLFNRARAASMPSSAQINRNRLCEAA
jgi:hypothetical protein